MKCLERVSPGVNSEKSRNYTTFEVTPKVDSENFRETERSSNLHRRLTQRNFEAISYTASERYYPLSYPALPLPYPQPEGRIEQFQITTEGLFGGFHPRHCPEW